MLPEPQRIILVAQKPEGEPMGREKRRNTSGKHREEDPQNFENISHEVRKGQSPSVGEEGTEEDRRQWEKTRDLHEEAKQITEKADESRRKTEEGRHDHSQGRG